MRHRLTARTLVFSAALAGTFAATAFAQIPTNPSPSCTMCPGTYISNTEIEAYAARGKANQLVDQQVRQVDIGKANVGVAVVYRSKLDNPNAVVAEHDLVSEVYHVISGLVLLLGPLVF